MLNGIKPTGATWAGLSKELKRPGLSSGTLSGEKKLKSRNKGTDLSKGNGRFLLKVHE